MTRRSIAVLFCLGCLALVAGCRTPSVQQSMAPQSTAIFAGASSQAVDLTQAATPTLLAVVLETGPALSSPLPSDTPILAATLPTRFTATVTPGITATALPQTVTAPPPGELLYCLEEGCIYSARQIFLRPIPPDFNQVVDSTYRYGTNVYGARELHRGVEFVNSIGTPVLAVESGVVEYAGNDHRKTFGGLLDFYGNLVILRHDLPGWGEPVYTLYGHLSEIAVETGQAVTRGQQIGAVGKTGSAAGSHLHFEVRVGSNTKQAVNNPELWLEPLESGEPGLKNGTLVLRLFHPQGSVFSLEITIRNESNQAGAQRRSFYAETYTVKARRDPFWNENLVVSDLAPGPYRVYFTRQGRTYQKLLQIEPGRITLVEFDVAY